MKKALLTFLQIAVTVGLLFWVFHKRETRDAMADALATAQYRWILAAILAYAVVEFSAAFRWHLLLTVQGIRLSGPRVGGLFLIGMFFNLFLPGGTGGDVVKTYLLWKETPQNKPGALLAVVFDRMVGLIALIVITGTLIALRYGWLTRDTAAAGQANLLHNPRFFVWLVLLIFASAVLFVITTFVISGFNLVGRLPQRFPGRDKLIEISTAYHLYARHWRATAGALAASLVTHLGTFATFFFVARAFRSSAHVGLIDFFSIMPIERTISSLPLSVSGHGTREYVLQVMLFNLANVPPDTAALIGTTSFLVMLFCAAPGAVIYLFYRPSGAQRSLGLREMQAEVAAVEHGLGRQD